MTTKTTWLWRCPKCGHLFEQKTRKGLLGIEQDHMKVHKRV